MLFEDQTHRDEAGKVEKELTIVYMNFCFVIAFDMEVWDNLLIHCMGKSKPTTTSTKKLN